MADTHPPSAPEYRRSMSTNPDVPSAGGAPDSEAPAPATRERRRFLFNRWVDFLGLGGGSLFVLAAFAAFYPEDDEALTALLFGTLIVANFVNHPHFAHSYQLFYNDFMRKAFAPDSPLRHQYLFAGIMVPAVMIAFFGTTVALGNAPLLGLAANVMFFTVGWHYGKQGYGILMLDAAQKGTTFGASEKRHLLWNTYLTWLTVWLMVNRELATRDFWGLTYYVFETPTEVLFAVWTLNAVSAAVVVRDLFLRWRTDRRLPFNGLVAYVSSLYIWMIVGRLDPAVILIVPAFHSLQYLVVVWRYQLNVETSALREEPVRTEAPAGGGRWLRLLRSAPARVGRFVVVGTLLGAGGFWVAPIFLDTLTGYDRAVFGTTLFLFIGWVFINIHHYFIDAVMWRRENSETRRYLFAGQASGRDTIHHVHA